MTLVLAVLLTPYGYIEIPQEMDSLQLEANELMLGIC
jgi:hypothetical protein